MGNTSASVWSEEDRLATLRSFEVLDTPAPDFYTAMLRKAATILDTESAAIFLVDRDRQWLMAGVGTALTSTPRAWSICEHTFFETGPLVVPDTRADPRFRTNPLVVAEPGLRFYAGAAIRTCRGVPLGGLCVFDPQPRSAPLASAHASFLWVLADEVGLHLEIGRLKRLEGRLATEEDDDVALELMEASASWIGQGMPDFLRAVALERDLDLDTERNPLTPQQTRVLCWASRGKSAPEIAMILGLTSRTVRFHLAGAAARLGATRTSQAVALALSRKLIPLP